MLFHFDHVSGGAQPLTHRLAGAVRVQVFPKFEHLSHQYVLVKQSSRTQCKRKWCFSVSSLVAGMRWINKEAFVHEFKAVLAEAQN